MDSVKPSEAWERQPGESARAWQARAIYLEMGPTRSLVKVGQKLGKSRAVIEGWSKRWNWVSSSILFDTYNDSDALKMVAEKRAIEIQTRIEKWDRRDEEHADGAYLAWLYYFNRLAGIKSGTVKASIF